MRYDVSGPGGINNSNNNLAMDEVYTVHSSVHRACGGRMYGEAEGTVMKTLFCTH